MKVVIFLVLGFVLFAGLFFILRPTAIQQPGMQTIELSIRNNTIQGDSTIKVPLHTKVTFKITSDTKEELHLHGYDITIPLVKNGRTSVTFIADKSGGFPLELHGSEKEIALFEVSPY